MTRTERSVRRRDAPIWVVVTGGLSVLIAVVGAVGLLSVTDQLLASPVFDPGAVVRYGLPAARAVHDLAAALTIGALGTATWLVGPAPGRSDDSVSGPRAVLARVGAAAALVWFVASGAVVLLTAAEVSGTPVSTPGFGTIAVSFVVQIELGRALALSALLAGVVATVVWSTSRLAVVGTAAVLSIIAVLPLSLAGHSASSADHMNSVDSLALHLVASCVWVGGLAAVLIIAPGLRGQRAVVTRRYSTVAGWAFAVVAGSGIVNALLRLGSLDQLTSTYGLLVLGKVVAVVVLGTLGALHRTVTIGSLERRPGLFVRLAAAELLIMGSTVGLAVALARSTPPVDATEADPVSVLLGFPQPPPLSALTYLTAFWPSVLWLSVAGALAGAYLVWVVRLHRRGEPWPRIRVVAWLLGCAVLGVATSGGVGVYGMIHTSTHVVQHLILMIVVPLLWVLGSPLTLARRAVRPRTDGSLGVLETLVRADRSAPMLLLAHPVVAGLLLMGGTLVFYGTSLYELALSTHTGHVLMTTATLIIGALFIRALFDPAFSPTLRQVASGGVAAVLLAMGVVIMTTSTVLAAGWWYQIGQTDPVALLADQQRAGLVTMITAIMITMAVGVTAVLGRRSTDPSPTQLDLP